jgi:hypothetical protein
MKDFTKYDQEPVFKITKPEGETLLSKDHIK